MLSDGTLPKNFALAWNVSVFQKMFNKQQQLPRDAALSIPFLLILCLAGSALALECKVCQSTGDYRKCVQSAPILCSESLVNTTHLYLTSSNPSLRYSTYSGVPPVQFQCFQVNYTFGGLWSYHMGCTYTTTKICEGWHVPNKCRTQSAPVPRIADYNPHGSPDVLFPHKTETHIVHHHGVAPSVVVVTRNGKSNASSHGLHFGSLAAVVLVSWILRTMIH
ncbi:uncharacterized protein LOC125948241 [Anopheles darlingi]|uniref:uncharacterized protein LOC125948241 n=1 Tax=Anopheles darlingi TaxID=43151 RepID=UPI0021000D37|nr:uncharacterized protein LOC125948241 [Anopheles darlingi]